MFKKILLIIALALPALAHADNNHIEDGDRHFAAGEYDDAITSYNKHYMLTGDTITVNPKVRICTRCKRLLGSALEAAAIGEYDKAIEFYTSLSEINPGDPRINPGIENAMRMKSKETTYEIGDLFNGYRICFVDESGQHGFLLMANADIEVYFHTQLQGELPEGARLPSINELELIRPNARKVGLYNDDYWSSSNVDYVQNEKTKTGRYYLNFLTGERVVGKRTDTSSIFWIGNF